MSGIEQLFEDTITAAENAGDAVLMQEERRAITGRNLARALRNVTDNLITHGLSAQSVVLYGVRPSIDGFTLLLSTLRTGAATTFIEPGAGAELFARRIELLQPDWVMAESVLYLASAPTPLRGYLRRRGLELPRLSHLPGQHVRVGSRLPFVPSSLSFKNLAASPVAQPAAPQLDPSAPAFVIFTSGTTGAPKGVQHTGRSVNAAIRSMFTHSEFSSGDVVYTHNMHTFITGVLAGIKTVVSPMRFDPRRFLFDAEKHGVTHAFMLPVEAYLVALYCEREGRRLPKTLRRMFLYSAPITVPVLERVHALAAPDFQITCVYGMTELAPASWIDSRDKIAWSGDGDIVGRPAPGVETRINARGELEVRGAALHSGYVGHEPVDWHETGDHARLEPDGSIVLLGRAKDMLIRGEFNLYPSLYEPTISRIEGVGACAIVGAPDAVTADERVILFIEPDPRSSYAAAHTTPAKAAAFSARIDKLLRSSEYRIDHQALPDEIRVVEALPRSGRSSKIDRKVLRAWVSHHHGAVKS